MSIPTEADRQRWRESVRSTWTDHVEADRATARLIAEYWMPVGELMIAALRLRPGMRALDLATGFGEPAFSIAARVGPDGHVVATDLVPAALAEAERLARAMGIANVSFEQADAESLPFGDASFDAVSCRFGAMYFVDIERALGEMRRVLKPGGRVALAVWGPASENGYAQAIAPLQKHLPTAAPAESGAPTMFRFAEAGSLGAEIRAAGFADVDEACHRIVLPWGQPPEAYVQLMLDRMSPASGQAFAALPADVRAEAVAEAVSNLGEEYDGAYIRHRSSVIVASAVR